MAIGELDLSMKRYSQLSVCYDVDVSQPTEFGNFCALLGGKSATLFLALKSGMTHLCLGCMRCGIDDVLAERVFMFMGMLLLLLPEVA